jgi:hypothetical protein
MASNMPHSADEQRSLVHSAANPLATAEARALEAHALRIFAMPRVQTGKQAMRRRWRDIVGRDIPPEAEPRLDAFVEEFAFGHVLKAVNGDGNHPRVATPLFAPPHAWMGLQVPGSRGGGCDSPDNSYSFMPIDHGPRYEIRGQRHAPAPADTPHTLTDATFTMSLGHLDGRDLRVAPDGSFTITLDPEPADGRSNHLQTKPNCRYVFARESRSDWRQVPAGLSIRRLDPPTGPPLADVTIAERAVLLMGEGVAAMYGIMRTWQALEPNVITPPIGTAESGGFVSQKISMARILLQDDDAFVATIGHGGAEFRNFVLQDYWLRTLDYWNTTGSMNNGQGVPNADGCSTTYVVCRRDPGVHNWIDPAGLREVNLINRWQCLPRAPADGGPTATSLLTTVGALDDVLPPDMRRVSPSERAAQLSERLATFKLRFADR